jgi:hypothetical protein
MQAVPETSRILASYQIWRLDVYQNIHPTGLHKCIFSNTEQNVSLHAPSTLEPALKILLVTNIFALTVTCGRV